MLRALFFIAMEVQIKQTPSGYPSLVYGDVWLDDAHDPLAAAASVGGPEIKDRCVFLFGAGLGYRLLRLRDLGAQHIVAFEPDPQNLELATELLPQAFEGVFATHDLHQIVEHILKAQLGNFLVLASRPHQQVFPQAYDEFVTALNRVSDYMRAENALLQDRVYNVLETTLRNIPRLKSTPYALSVGRPLENTPAIIVSAGPSLDKNVHLLQAASEKAAIIAVNTAVPVMKKYGIPIDIAIGVEALSMSTHLRGSGAKATALCAAADSECYDLEGPLLMFIKDFVAFRKIANDSNVEALPYGSGVSTAAVCLARHWGASAIILVGQDLACPQGRYYATGTGREGAHIKHDGPFLYLETCTDDDFRSKNVSLPSRYQPRFEIDAWGGGHVSTTRDLHGTVEWLGAYAEATEGTPRLINATEGGARIPGWHECPLQQVLSEFGSRSDSLAEALRTAQPIDAAVVSQISDDIREQARVTARIAAATLRSISEAGFTRGAERTTRLAQADPMLERIATFAVHKRQRQTPHFRGLSANASVRVRMEAIRDCAERVVEVCDEVRQLPESDIADAAE